MTDLLVVQATPFCNIDCAYCYLPNRQDRRRMPPEVVHAVFREVLPSALVGQMLTVAWHAGEPFVLPPAWYAEAFAVAERYRPEALTLRHSFQTNATLVSDAWIAFLQGSGASVSVSLDGPRALHDLRRRTRAGGGTHALAESGFERLREAGLEPGVLAVLTREALADPDGLIDYFVALGVRRLALNVEEQEAAHRASPLGDPGFAADYRRFLRRVFERVAGMRGGFALRELDLAMGIIAAGRVPPGLNQETEPMRILSVSADGRVSSFSPELLGMTDPRHGDFTFGNLLHDPIGLITERVLASRLAADISRGVAACGRGCAHFRFCGGGSPSNKLYENGSFASTETRYCQMTRQAVIEVALDLFEAGVLAAPRRAA